MLVSWEIWNEKNVRIFKKFNTLPGIVIAKIKMDVKTWVLADVKHTGLMLPGD
jgi:hypothetical protein